MEEVKSKREKNKKWIIAVAVFLGLCSIGIGFLYYKHATRHFTRSEYIKEVIIQNDDFNNLIDEFLDKVSSYTGTQEDIEKVENSAGKITDFVSVLKENGYSVVNIDSTLLAQRPKMRPHIDAMRKNIADACGISADFVSVKATTEEKLGFTGREEGISAHAVCLIEK